MRFCVLGPLEVWDGEVRLDVSRAPERALLALLLLHRNEVLSLEEIGHGLWGPNPSADAEGVVSRSIAHLRETLGPETFVAHPWGYGLRVPAGSVDAEAFAQLVDRARVEAPENAIATLREALALWRGPVLEDVADNLFAQAEIHRLEKARLDAETRAIELSFPERKDSEPGNESKVRRLHFKMPPPRVLAAVGAAIIVAATIVVVGAVTGGAPRHVATGPNMVAALDPKANRVVDAFTVGSVPSNVAVSANAVWDYNSNDKTVSLIDPRTRLVRTVSTGGGVSSFGAARNSAWVGNGWSGTVSRIDPQSAEVVRTIRLPGERWTAAGFIAASPSEIWISGVTLPRGAPSPLKPLPNPPQPPSRLPAPHFLAWRLDTRTNRITRTISLEHVGNFFFFRTFLVTGDSVFVRGDYGLERIDRRTGRVGFLLSLPSHGCCESAGLAVGEGSIWVIGLARNVLWRIDRRRGGAVITATIPLRGQPAGIAVGDGAVWVADATGAILRIDPKTNKIVKRIAMTGVPHGLAFGLGRLWIALD